MDIDQLRQLFKNRTKLIPVKLNPKLVDLLNMTVRKDKELKSRNEFFERSVVKYLEEKGTL